MAIEEVGEINMVLLPAQSTDLLWRTCQVGAAGKTSRFGLINFSDKVGHG